MIHNNFLISYRDKAYIMALLCQEHSDYYNFIKNIIHIPLVISSSIVSILNSYNNESNEIIKIITVIITTIISILLAFLQSFKIDEKKSMYMITAKKFEKVCHNAEDLLFNNLNEINVDDIKKIIDLYDAINDSIDFNYINFIKLKFIKKFKNNRSLPNILNCTSDPLQNNIISNEMATIIIDNS